MTRTRRNLDADEPVLWERWWADRDLADRTRLAELHAELPGRVAVWMGRSMHSNVEYADLASYGAFGLLDAIDKFDPSKAPAFVPYAITRIRGAIYDGLRKMDPLPRKARTRMRHIDEAYLTLEQQLGRAPTAAELSDRTALSADDIDVSRRMAAAARPVGLDAPVGSGDGATVGGMAADPAPGPDEQADRAETLRQVRAAVDALPDRSRQVVHSYYGDGMTQRQISVQLGVTDSRVCQILSSATRQIREQLATADL